MNASIGNDGVWVPGRRIPFPRSISASARAALIACVDNAGIPFSANVSMPAPDDVSGWAAAQAAMRAPMDALYRARAGAARVYLEIHGGSLVYGDSEACRLISQIAADQHRVRTCAVDHRMPPLAPYPAALDDAVALCRTELERHEAANVIIGGASAGGNLAAATVLRARYEGRPLPAAAVLLTPELGLTESRDGFETNWMTDGVLPVRLTNANLLYAAEHDLSHPYLWPLFGDVGAGFPPTFHSGGHTRPVPLERGAHAPRAAARERTGRTACMRGDTTRWLHGRLPRSPGTRRRGSSFCERALGPSVAPASLFAV